MARPINLRSVEAAAEAKAGKELGTNGHSDLGVFAIVDGDPTGVEIEVEVSPDGEHWSAPVHIRNDRYTLSGEDFTTDGTSGLETAASFQSGCHFEEVRARVVEPPASGTVTVWIALGGWGGPGRSSTIHPKDAR